MDKIQSFGMIRNEDGGTTTFIDGKPVDMRIKRSSSYVKKEGPFGTVIIELECLEEPFVEDPDNKGQCKTYIKKYSIANEPTKEGIESWYRDSGTLKAIELGLFDGEDNG
jgi:hypothetical protein